MYEYINRAPASNARENCPNLRLDTTYLFFTFRFFNVNITTHYIAIFVFWRKKSQTRGEWATIVRQALAHICYNANNNDDEEEDYTVIL